MGLGHPEPWGLNACPSVSGRLEDGASKGDYSGALRFIVYFVVVVVFLPTSPFWNGNVDSMSHHCILEALYLFDFTESQMESNVSQNKHTLSLTCIWFR